MKEENLSISNFKIFFKKIILPFLLIFTLLGAMVNYFFQKKVVLGSEISGAYKVNRIINETNQNEIPFLGSSRAEGTFIPDSLVKLGFNYGMVGTQDNVWLFFLNEECKKNKTGPIVINFDLDGLDYSIGDISNYLYNINYAPVKKLMGEKYKAQYEVPFFKYYGYFEIYTKYYLNGKTNFTKYTNKGASVEKDELPIQQFNELIEQRLNEKTVFKNEPALLDELMDLIHDNPKRKLIFVVNPYHASYFNAFVNYNDAIKFLSFLEANNNVTVLNFAKFNLPNDCYINTTHLNAKGALQFNRILKDSLTKYMNV